MSGSSRRAWALLAAAAAAACGSDSSTGPSAAASAPALVTPAAAATLDNGCRSGTDSLVWEFDWTDVPGATAYHLYVIGPTATIPLIDASDLTASTYRHVQAALVADANRRGWHAKVRALVNGEWGPWSAERTFDVEPEDTDCPPGPTLLIPSQGAVLDNGCDDFSNGIVWEFAWSATPGATAYHLYVIGGNAIYPVIDNDDLRQTNYVSSRNAYIVEHNRHGWRWRVRALVDGAWGDWSGERTFSVERLNTDCP